MGKYVNQTSKGPTGASFAEKCQALLEDGAVKVNPTEFQPNLVCVVDNFIFAAAGYAYDEQEFKAFNISSDTRPKQWFVYEKVEQFAD
jgi:hypothetical protein